jgi:hypothetical protein
MITKEVKNCEGISVSIEQLDVNKKVSKLEKILKCFYLCFERYI